MQAIDTNILVRFLTDDDADQSLRARILISEGDIHVSTTVLLETEWVLRRGYELEKGDVSAAFRRIAGLPLIDLEEPGRVARALEWFDLGLDFADALHLAGVAERCDSFITFDRRLVRHAQGKLAITVKEPEAIR